MDDLDKKEDDPDEQEIKRICKIIQKGWDKKQRKSRSVYKIEQCTVGVIKTSDIDSENNY